jgi:hypothetical protein
MFAPDADGIFAIGDAARHRRGDGRKRMFERRGGAVALGGLFQRVVARHGQHDECRLAICACDALNAVIIVFLGHPAGRR